MLTVKNKCHHWLLLQDGSLRLKKRNSMVEVGELESIGAIRARGPLHRAHSSPSVTPTARRSHCEGTRWREGKWVLRDSLCDRG